MNLIALRQKMIEKNKSNKELAFELGISRSAMQRKLSGKTQFSQSELKVLISILQLSKAEILYIFFDDKVQITVIANKKSIKNNSISISFLAVTVILLSMRLMWG